MPRIEVSIPVPEGQRVSLADVEALCRLARSKGLSDTAEVAPYLQPGVMGMSRVTGYAVRAEVEEPPGAEPHIDGSTWGVPGANATTSQIADAMRRGLAEPGVERIVLDREAAQVLLGGRG